MKGRVHGHFEYGGVVLRQDSGTDGLARRRCCDLCWSGRMEEVVVKMRGPGSGSLRVWREIDGGKRLVLSLVRQWFW